MCIDASIATFRSRYDSNFCSREHPGALSVNSAVNPLIPIAAFQPLSRSPSSSSFLVDVPSLVNLRSFSSRPRLSPVARIHPSIIIITTVTRLSFNFEKNGDE
jgi:hypothetical protein